jgi:hypothetical protein
MSSTTDISTDGFTSLSGVLSPSGYVPLRLSRIMCPTAVETGSWEVIVLVLLYFLVGLFAVYELFRTVCKHTHTLLSFRSAFFALSALTMFGRGFLITVPLGPWLAFNMMFFVFMMPIFVQCVTFSLLIVFLARAILVLNGRGGAVRRFLYPGYAVSLVVFFVLNVVFAWLASARWRTELNPSDFDQNMSIFWFCEFGTILATGAYSAYSTFRILHGSLLDQTKRRRVKLLFALSLVFFLLYLFRTIYDILYFFGHNPLQSAIGNWIHNDTDRDHLYFYTALLAFYSLTEVLPTLLVIVVIRRALPSRTSAGATINSTERERQRQPLLSPSKAAAM